MTSSMIEGKRADSARRRERVLKSLDAVLRTGGDITVSGLARAARVDRSFLYRHRDLLERVHAAATTPVTEGGQAAVTRASLQADLANALERNTRLSARVRQLEKRLSGLFGEQTWRESGLGAPPDIDQLHRRIVMLEQEVAEKNEELEERTEEAEAARAANRELTLALNQHRRFTFDSQDPYQFQFRDGFADETLWSTEIMRPRGRVYPPSLSGSPIILKIRDSIASCASAISQRY
ncbi:DUF6262 family protein [Streptomyces sp. NPDC013157]|uniref:DUF6262 family protein n=1 Tax=Streptomyces sp. NPDC013157 TaxID=3364861 RepID=UPI003682BED6